MENSGKVTVGVTVDGARRIEELLQTGWFPSELSIYLMSISVALAQNPPSDPGALSGVTTKYNVGSLDRDGRVRSMLALFGTSESQDPYEYAERLADGGLKVLHSILVEQQGTLAEALGLRRDNPTEVFISRDANTDQI
jgi:hypothetical protein